MHAVWLAFALHLASYLLQLLNLEGGRVQNESWSCILTYPYCYQSIPATATESIAVSHQNSDNDKTSLLRLLLLCHYSDCPSFWRSCNSSLCAQWRHFANCSKWYVPHLTTLSNASSMLHFMMMMTMVAEHEDSDFCNATRNAEVQWLHTSAYIKIWPVVHNMLYQDNRLNELQ